MGDIADMMLDGTLCQGCGVFRTNRPDGIPGFCKSCQREETATRGNNKAPAKKCKCPTCGKMVKEAGLADHMRDAHPAALAAPAVVVSAEPVADALRSLDARLRECADAGLTAYEAYDSFYQEVVADALATPVGPDAVDARDAARYRWLRDCVLVGGVINDEIYVHVDHPDHPNRWALVGEELDAAIDAALASTKPSKGAA